MKLATTSASTLSGPKDRAAKVHNWLDHLFQEIGD
jgi:hypothetical protein